MSCVLGGSGSNNGGARLCRRRAGSCAWCRRWWAAWPDERFGAGFGFPEPSVSIVRRRVEQTGREWTTRCRNSFRSVQSEFPSERAGPRGVKEIDRAVHLLRGYIATTEPRIRFHRRTTTRNWSAHAGSADREPPGRFQGWKRDDSSGGRAIRESESAPAGVRAYHSVGTAKKRGHSIDSIKFQLRRFIRAAILPKLPNFCPRLDNLPSFPCIGVRLGRPHCRIKTIPEFRNSPPRDAFRTPGWSTGGRGGSTMFRWPAGVATIVLCCALSHSQEEPRRLVTLGGRFR